MPVRTTLSSQPLLAGWDQVRRILVMRLDNIGDVIMTGPALRSIKTALPDVHLTLLASPAGSQVAPLLPWVDEVLSLRAVWQDVSGSLGLDPQRELELVDSLRQENFDAVVILTSFSQSPYPPAYAAYLAGIPLRLGHSKEFGGFVLSHWFKPPPDEFHQVDRNLALLQAVGFPAPGVPEAGLPIDPGRRLELRVPVHVRQRAAALLREAGGDPHVPYIAMAPGASCPARRYPAERFARLAALLHAYTGRQVVLLGSARERALVEPFAHLLQGERRQAPAVSLVGETSVPEMAAIIAGSSLVIANDSAPMHIADAFGTPMVILFSGTELESQWRPRFAPARLLRQPTPCQPCYRFQCPYQMECLDITPQQVASVAMDLLEQPGAASSIGGPADQGNTFRSPASVPSVPFIAPRSPGRPA